MTLSDTDMNQVLTFVNTSVKNIFRSREVDQVDDLVGEVMLQVLERRDTYEAERATVEGWLSLLVKQTIRDHRKRLKRERIFSPLAEEHTRYPDGADSGVELALNEAFERLTPLQRDLVVLVDRDGVELTRAARQLNLSKRSAARRLKDARIALKEGLR
jgi:RNA polymerase sigma factor (sigma-70 family)